MLGSGNRISARRIQHNDAAACRRLDIDIVHPNPGTPDHAQLRAGIQNISGDFCLAAYDKSAECGNNVDKFPLA
jgi:hypothetical protein